MSNPSEPADALQVVCLCAAWCGVCRDWRTPFEQAAALHPQLRFDWVDVEDEAEAMGDVDIETFPTLLIARAGRPLFYGPVPPSAAQLERLIARLKTGGGGAAVSAEAAALLQRLASRVLRKS
ncbi:MAG: thioredoxin family protein [Gemmatimonadetes bacterium]|nr:thioredoxin family protein [Gemmatimonadota bacterium]